jgi:hypothetical protein
MWKQYGKAGQATDDIIIRLVHFTCWTTKTVDTHSEYVIHISFTRQQWLRERSSLLCLHMRSPCRVTRIRCSITKEAGPSCREV